MPCICALCLGTSFLTSSTVAESALTYQSLRILEQKQYKEQGKGAEGGPSG